MKTATEEWIELEKKGNYFQAVHKTVGKDAQGTPAVIVRRLPVIDTDYGLARMQARIWAIAEALPCRVD